MAEVVSKKKVAPQARGAEKSKRFWITHIVSRFPLSKEYLLSKKRKLVQKPAAALSRGKFKRRWFGSLAGLLKFLVSMTPRHALCYGTFGAKSGEVVSERLKSEEPEIYGQAKTRTKKCMRWSSKPSVLFLDYDPPKGMKALSRQELIREIRRACPFLKDVEILWRPSASSYIRRKGKTKFLRGLRGQHLYLVVTNGTRIPEIGQAIADRLWLAGHGRYDISSAGTLLERTLVDTAVWQPERLDFVGGSTVEPPLIQSKLNGVIIPGQVKALSIDMIAPLSDEERNKVQRLKAQAKSAATPEAQCKKEQYVGAKAKKLAGSGASEDQIDDARKIISAALEDQVLYGKFPLQTSDGKVVMVDDLLNHPDQWHGKDFSDPLEWDYRGDTRIARAFLKGVSPIIHSFAHGGRTFRLRRDRPAIQVVPGEMGRVVDHVLSLLKQETDIFEDPQGNVLVRVAGTTRFPVTSTWLYDRIGRLARFEKGGKK